MRAEGPVKGGVIKAGLVGGGSTDTLDPALALVQVMQVFNKQWGEMIVELAPDGGIEYRIAEEIGASDDAKTWTLKIRDGVEFHNGKTVTAEDVLATLERHSDEKSKSGALGYLKGFESIKASGKEVIITLKEPNADLPYLLTDYHLHRPAQWRQGRSDCRHFGAGPYKVTVNEPGVRHGGERFANYWQGDKMGHADQVEIIVINDATARISALQGGQVHMINRVEPKVVDLIKHVPGVTIRNVCRTRPLRLHHALQHGTVRQQRSAHGAEACDGPRGDARQDPARLRHRWATTSRSTPSYPLFSDDIEQRKYDPEKAAFHYKKSGHSGPILLRTSDVAFPGAVDAAQLYQQSCAKAGITIEVKREPGDGYWTEVWNKQPFSTSYWGGRSTQDQMYSTAYISTADWNDTRFLRPDFDKMVLAARAELDEAKRKAMYRDMAVIVRDEGGLILPMFNQFIDATGPKVEGWVLDPHQELMNGYALSKCWLAA